MIQREAIASKDNPPVFHIRNFAMNITVLNGSPKGELSVTMQYVAYLAKLYPQHEFNILQEA